MGNFLRIGELARLSGVTPRTIRHYESLGLLPAAHRGPSGYREYQPQAVVAIAEIRRLRALGMPLSAIAEARRRDEDPGSLATHLRELKGDIDMQSAQLARRRRSLDDLEAAVGRGETVLGAGEPEVFDAVRSLLVDAGASARAVEEARRVFAVLASLALPDSWTEVVEAGLALVRRDEQTRCGWVQALEIAAELRDLPVDDPAVAIAARRIAELSSFGSDVRSALTFTDPSTAAIFAAVASCFSPAQISAFAHAAVEIGALS